MAGKTKNMSQIKQLLLLKKEGVSNRKAAEIVGINKETANNYVRKAFGDELGIEGLLKLDDPVLEHRLKGGNPAYTEDRKSTRLNSSHANISYAVFCLKKKKSTR